MKKKNIIENNRYSLYSRQNLRSFFISTIDSYFLLLSVTVDGRGGQKNSRP